MEEWRDVVGYEDCYEVSSLGHVRSKDRQSISYGTRMCERKGRMLKVNQSQRYLMVDLCKEGVRKTRTVHGLVAEAFLPNPDASFEIDHIDRDKHNNALPNLRWVSKVQNQANRGTPRHNTSGEKYIQVQYRVCGRKDGVSYQKAFKTIEEAKAFRLEVFGE
jgi:hypothetical protein